MKISRMWAAGELIPLRRGLYLSDRSVEPLAYASAIYGPSYVSFESALAWCGLIPEWVEEVVVCGQVANDNVGSVSELIKDGMILRNAGQRGGGKVTAITGIWFKPNRLVENILLS